MPNPNKAGQKANNQPKKGKYGEVKQPTKYDKAGAILDAISKAAVLGSGLVKVFKAFQNPEFYSNSEFVSDIKAINKPVRDPHVATVISSDTMYKDGTPFSTMRDLMDEMYTEVQRHAGYKLSFSKGDMLLYILQKVVLTAIAADIRKVLMTARISAVYAPKLGENLYNAARTGLFGNITQTYQDLVEEYADVVTSWNILRAKLDRVFPLPKMWAIHRKVAIYGHVFSLTGKEWSDVFHFTHNTFAVPVVGGANIVAIKAYQSWDTDKDTITSIKQLIEYVALTVDKITNEATPDVASAILRAYSEVDESYWEEITTDSRMAIVFDERFNQQFRNTTLTAMGIAVGDRYVNSTIDFNTDEDATVSSSASHVTSKTIIVSDTDISEGAELMDLVKNVSTSSASGIYDNATGEVFTAIKYNGRNFTAAPLQNLSNQEVCDAFQAFSEYRFFPKVSGVVVPATKDNPAVAITLQDRSAYRFTLNNEALNMIAYAINKSLFSFVTSHRE